MLAGLVGYQRVTASFELAELLQHQTFAEALELTGLAKGGSTYQRIAAQMGFQGRCREAIHLGLTRQVQCQRWLYNRH